MDNTASDVPISIYPATAVCELAVVPVTEEPGVDRRARGVGEGARYADDTYPYTYFGDNCRCCDLDTWYGMPGVFVNQCPPL